MSQMIIAAFTDRMSADKAVGMLEQAGYGADKISVITKHEGKTVETSPTGASVADGALSGATTGGAIGGVAGLLAGAGILPALAGLLIGGPIAAALGATGIVAATISGVVTGAAAGGLIGGLVNLGLPEETAKYYEQTVTQGGMVVAVNADSESYQEPWKILEENGAKEIKSVEK